MDRYEGLALQDQAAIDRLCSRYEMALRAGEDPSLEEYLGEPGVGDRACLLTELVALDRAYRSGDGSSRDAYVARFPDFTDAIDEAFRAASPTRVAPPPLAQQAVVPVPAIDGHEILGELGRGGMGVVYKARHLRLKRLVALKVILQGDFASEQQRARFLVETEMLGRLRHPNVVQVFEAGQQNGRPFLALEYVEGGSLAQRLAAEGVMAPREAAALVGQLARGVHHAHLHGIIHRDIKPANVLLSPSPSGAAPKVTDFGVACQPGGSELSRTGQFLGTPSYVSPEQARGERDSLGPRADVYSLGAVLYEALTGRPPFRAMTPLETVRQVLTEEPAPPSRLRPGLDRDLNTICLKCLSKEPEGRYASADALADDLDRWLAGEPIAARPAGRPERAWKWARRKPSQAGLLAVSLLLLLAVIVMPTVAFLRLSHEQDLTRRADKQRRQALVRSLQTAAPDSVPFLVEDLAAAPEQVLPLLREQFDDPQTRFRAAVVLTLLGDDRTEYLLTAIPSTLPAESGNLARAFHASSDRRLADELDRRGRQTTEVRLQVRYAILLLDLGDGRLARSLLAKADPTPRSTFLEEVRTWHGALAAWPAVVDAADDEDYRSALCAAVGRVDHVRLDPSVRRSLAAALSRQFRDAPDPGTHAAAEWSLRQWGVPLPKLDDATGERRWFVNHSGMTMMSIPPGPVPLTFTVTVVHWPCYVSDREVTLGLYRQFMADKTAERPQSWGAGPSNRLGADHPVPFARMPFVAPFCNWLSARDGRRPCYRPDRNSPTGWACNLTADGYRLPTEAEWEHAQRAGSLTRFFFGDEARWLPMYAHVGDLVTAPCGDKLPNRWGLFDVVGNLWEATGDGVSAHPNRTLTSMVIRGGGYDSGSNHCLAHSRVNASMQWGEKAGFRVVCGSAKPTKMPMPAHRDQRAELACLVRFAGDDDAVLLHRANLHGYFGEWRSAAADYRRLMDLLPDNDDEAWTTCAALLAHVGDGAEYRKTCRRLLDRYKTRPLPLTAERVAKACLLAEGREDLDEVFMLLKVALSTDAEKWARPYAELALGMAEYRRGDHAAARTSLEGCVAPDPQAMNAGCQALRGFFLAMAHHRLGRHDEAAKAYKQAQEIFGKLVEAQKQGHGSWRDILRAAIAEAEAKKLLQSRK
jgi:tetratricopeptide (TPR) repeat protein/tRNA A-37 threonylcarbamoyl transferase component Bud32